ncbi:MAG: hypothetical protein ACLVB5_14660 [Christensenellales bacterium]
MDAKIIKLLQDAAYVCQLEGKLVQTGLDAKYLTVADRFVPRLMAAPDGAPVQNLLRRGSRQRAERVRRAG